MAAIGDLVQETSASTGTGNLTLSAVTGKRRFSVVFSTGGTNVFWYFISNRGAAEWEVGTGSMSDANTLVRDTVVASSNANEAVDFGAGTKDVVNDLPAALQLVAAQIVAAAGKTTPHDNDSVGLVDSEASNVLKELTIANLRAAMLATALTQGKHTIQLWPGSFMIPATGGPEYQKVSATNQLPGLAFDTSADESVWFAFRAPKSSAETTITFDFVWSHPATATNFGVAFFLELVALSNSDLISTAMGTAIELDDTGGTTNDIFISDESGAVTPGNTWAEGDLIIGRLYRDVSDGADTLAVDARIHLVNLYLTLNAGNDA